MEKTKTLPKTHWKKLYNPNYLGDWSFEPSKDKILTIKSVGLEEVFNPTDKAKDDCTVINWMEKEKPMIVNKTNANLITSVLGSPYIEDWVGKKIQLFTKEISAFGGLHNAIRVRPFIPVVKKPELTPDHDRWSDAIKALKGKRTTIEGIRINWELSSNNEKKLIDATVE